MVIDLRHICRRWLVLILSLQRLLIIIVLGSLVIYSDWNISEDSLLNLMQSPRIWSWSELLRHLIHPLGRYSHRYSLIWVFIQRRHSGDLKLPNNSWSQLYTLMMIAKLRIILYNHEVLLRSLMHVLDHSACARVNHLAVQLDPVVWAFAIDSYLLH